MKLRSSLVRGSAVVGVERTIQGQKTFVSEEIPMTEKIVPLNQTGRLVKVSLGRTINLGDYQSARINVGIFAVGEYDTLRSIVSEILDREVAVTSQVQRENSPLPEINLEGAEISIEYGLTLKIKAFEMARIDIAYQDAVEEGQSLEEAFAFAQAFLTKHMTEESNKVSGMKSSTDIGI